MKKNRNIFSSWKKANPKFQSVPATKITNSLSTSIDMFTKTREFFYIKSSALVY